MKLNLKDYITLPAVNVSDMEYEDKVRYVTDVAARVWFEENPPEPPVPPTPVIPDNEIWYTGEFYDLAAILEDCQSSGKVIPYHVLSNDFDGEKWIITFDHEVEMIGSTYAEPVPPTYTDNYTEYPFFAKYSILDDNLEVIRDVECNIKTVTLPDSVTRLLGGSFYDNLITSINLPSSILTIGIDPDPNHSWLDGSIIGSCNNLTEITYFGTKEQWNSIEKFPEWYVDSPIETIHCTDGDIIVHK